MPSPGLIIAAAASGSGKPALTLGLLRLLARQGGAVRGCKIGPDYIDPAFHAAASGADCFNLDAWAMRATSLAAVIAAAQPHDLLIVEGVMGLFDGAALPAPAGALDLAAGSTAQLAAQTGWPVVLVLNVKGQGATAAAVARGLQQHHPAVRVAGVVCNNVGSPRHGEILRQAFAQIDLPLLGLVPRETRLRLPDRHLGLVQAGEHDDLQAFLDAAADHLAEHVDVAALRALAAAPRDLGPRLAPGGDLAQALLPPLGQRIAVARDVAFAFAYPAQLAAWRQAGVEISSFSPLLDEAPDADAAAIFLPGGYPELHAGKLAGNAVFISALHRAAASRTGIYCECGRQINPGGGLVRAGGCRPRMLGSLPGENAFAQRQ